MRALVLVATAAWILTSCSLPRVQRSVPPCPLPPPPPACEPSAYVPTTMVPWDLAPPAWTLDRVVGAQSELQEWGLVPYGSHDLLVRGQDAATTTYVPVRRRDAHTIEQCESCVFDSTTTPLAELIDRIAWDEQPTLSPNGRLLVFSSNRPGSVGGTDLVVRQWDGERWLDTQPLAGVINTPCDELSPQFLDDTTLLFSSAGHQTVGGYDLFVATLRMSDRRPTAVNVTNLGAWINTEHDEIFPRMVGDTALYFGSNRPHGTQRTMDLFVATRSSAAPTTTVTGTVVNQVTNEPIARATVTARDAASPAILGSTTTNNEGSYALKLPVATTVVIAADAPGLFFDDVTIATPTHADTSIQAPPLALPVVYTLRINFPSAVFDQPYEFTLDSTGAETPRRWVNDLDRLAENLLASSSHLQRVVLVGHTDDVDSDESNFVLGEQRVRFVIQQLVQRGVDPALLEARSSGESQLPVRRDGESLDRWRKRARRVELQKVELQ